MRLFSQPLLGKRKRGKRLNESYCVSSVIFIFTSILFVLSQVIYGHMHHWTLLDHRSGQPGGRCEGMEECYPNYVYFIYIETLGLTLILITGSRDMKTGMSTEATRSLEYAPILGNEICFYWPRTLALTWHIGFLTLLMLPKILPQPFFQSFPCLLPLPSFLLPFFQSFLPPPHLPLPLPSNPY